jgi:hypothetical protein
MLDIDDFEGRIVNRETISELQLIEALAEIRRLRGTMEHRKCTCDRGVRADSVGDSRHWIYCSRCMSTTNEFETEEAAWAAWDGGITAEQMPVPMRPMYTVRRVRRSSDITYGPIHYSNDGERTLCGTQTGPMWWILTSNRDGKATCRECLLVNGERQKNEADRKD